MEIKELKNQIDSLTVFKSIRQDQIISTLRRFLEQPSVSLYCDFVSDLYSANGGHIDLYIEELCNKADNFYIRACGNKDAKKVIPKEIAESVERELKILQRIANVECDWLCSLIDSDIPLPRFTSEGIDIISSFNRHIANINKNGYGMYAQNHMFSMDDDGNIIPICHPDRTKLSDLIGYTEQRSRVIANTKALLDGKPAANVLLTGDAGTGKSSTIKAIANELYGNGLRIIEIRKDQIMKIGSLLDTLAENPLKFIIFIDDLSFTSVDESFSHLKAILEGSVSARSGNTVIYATSNRRHVIGERFSDRDGDDIHKNDTMQELLSFSERFGLHITFSKPDKQTYLEIVHQLAEKSGIGMPTKELDLIAERFALERGGRSARLARQLIDSLLSQ